MIRPSSASDSNSIRHLLDAAFSPSLYESRLRDLVAGADLKKSEWVIERDSQIVGHVLYTPATNGTTFIGFHLAPVAVHPDFQNQGIGTELVRETIRLEPIASESVFVLGDPKFYERFGFTATDSARCPFDPENEHFRALRWNDSQERFVIGYASAFQQAEAPNP